MGLESATYISDLVATNPVVGDQVSTADDHIRLIKSAVKATFPNVAGAVTATHTELSMLAGAGNIRTSANDQIAFKAGNTTRTSTAVLAADPDLVLTLTGPGSGTAHKYAIQAYIRVQQNNTAADFSFAWRIASEDSASNPLVGFDASLSISTNGAAAINGLLSGTDQADLDQTGSGGNGYVIKCSGVVSVLAASRQLSFQWSQRVSTASDTIVSEGSWVRATRMF